MDEMVTDSEGRHIDRSGRVWAGPQSIDREQFNRTTHRLHGSTGLSGGVSITRDEETAPQEWIRWVVVSLSAIGMVVLALPVALSQLGG